jgi:type III secretory pathway component EscV/tetratricopeptide (TPR) repeat protein
VATEATVLTFDAIAAWLGNDERFLSADQKVRADVLEALRGAFAGSADPHDRRTAFCAQVGAAVDPKLRAALIDVREAFDRDALESVIAGIERQYARSEHEGWSAWVRAMADAVVRFRPTYTAALCAHSFPFTRAREAVVSELRRAVACMQQARWEEADEAVAFLSEQQDIVPPQTRARLIAMRGQIELWRFLEKKRAQALLAEAERLAPADVMVLGVLGDWHAQDGNGEKAIACYRRAIEVAPGEANGYIGVGDAMEKEGAGDKNERSRQAEDWYRRAVAMAPGDGTGFDRLIRTLVRADAFRTNPSETLSLLERRIAVDPEGEFDAYLALGDQCRDYCRENSVTDAVRAWYRAQSRMWYERARALQPGWPLGCPGLAELCKDEGDFDEAEREGQRAISLAPECPSGYLFLGSFYESRERRSDALNVYERFPARPDRWKLYAMVTVARLRAENGDYGGAIDPMLDVLRLETTSDREQVFAEPVLETLAEDLYKKHGNTALARQVFDDILATVGERYRARYHHLLGNLHYYFSEYQTAADHYREAIVASPKEPSYYRYLAGALRGLSRFAEAESEIDRAFALDHDEKRQRQELAILANQQGNRAFESGAYQDAIPSYQRAAELDPSTAVYQSNLALAWERLEIPGRRVENLLEAASWYSRAQQAAGDQRHQDRIERLQRRLILAKGYGEQSLNWFALVTPIAVEVAQDLVPLVSGSTVSRLSPDLEREVEAMRTSVAATLGVTIPGIRFRGSDRSLVSGTYVILLDDVPLVSGVSSPKQRFCPGTADELAKWGVSGDPAVDPLSGAPGVWVAEDRWPAATVAGAPLFTVTGYLIRHLEAVVRQNAVEFVGHQELIKLLDGVPTTVRDGVRTTGLSPLTNVCRGLVAEGAPLRPFTEICKTFKSLTDDGLRPRDVVERIRLLPEVRNALPGRDGRAYLRTGETFEAEIRRALYRKSDRVVLAMIADQCRDALEALRHRVAEAGPRPLGLVVADSGVRAFIRRLVEAEFPHVPVLSVAEARDDVETLAGRVDLTATASPAAVDFKSPATLGLPADPVIAAGTEPTSAPVIHITVAPVLMHQPSMGDDRDLDSLLALMRDGLFNELGLMVPAVELRESDSFGVDGFEVRIGEGTPVKFPGLQTDEAMINEAPDRLALLGLHGRPSVNPAAGTPSTIVRTSEKELSVCRAAGLTTWGPAGYVVLQVSALLRREAATLQTDGATRHLIDSLALTFPDLADAALQRFPLATIARVLRHLLAEEIPIRNLRAILEHLLLLDGSSDVDLDRIVFTANAEPLCFDPQGRPVADLPSRVLADHVRTGLKRAISSKYTGGSGALSAYLLAPDIEQRLRRVPEQPLTPNESSRLLDAVGEKLTTDTKSPRPVLLTNLDVRSTARALLRAAFPTLAVVCYQELSAELNIMPRARITWR